MKFNIESSALLKELQKLSGVIANNNTLPILDNFLFTISDSEISICASDLETTIITKLAAKASENGSIALPARLLVDTLKTFSSQPLTFLIDENTLGVEIQSGNGKYKLSGQSANEFPRVPSMNSSASTTLESDILAQAINKTIFASGNDDLRPILSGVLFEFSPEKIAFVATDSHKLVYHSTSENTAETTASFILPKKPLNLLKNILPEDGNVMVEYNETNARFCFEETTIICRLVEGKYPNYEAVIPKENPNKLVIDTNDLLSSVKRISIFANKTTHEIRLKINGNQLIVSSEDRDFANQAEERIACQYEGEDMEIGFNSRFIIEILNNIGAEQICLQMSTPNRAGIILPLDGQKAGEKSLMLVMPVMINN